MLKNYIVNCQDNSMSMTGIRESARTDYNLMVESIKKGTVENGQDTIVSVVHFGIKDELGYTVVKRGVVNSSVHALNPLDHYNTTGSATPLLDGVLEAINICRSVPDVSDPNVAFVINVTTDGGENSSKKTNKYDLAALIRNLQQTDRWSFIFRVPRGHKSYVLGLGIPEGNILEWETSDRGMRESTVVASQSYNSFFAARSKGATSTQSFYTDAASIAPEVLAAVATDITSEVSLWPVSQKENDMEIRDFVEGRLGQSMLKGAAFYQLTKTEDEVQDYKILVIRNKTTNEIFGGKAARDLLGLPSQGTIRLKPGNHGNYDVFIQSTSVNRKVKVGSQVLYWPKAGTPFLEGKSAKKRK